MENKQYHHLLERMFIGAAEDAMSMVSEEKANVIVDLRSEAESCSVSDPEVQCIRVPITDAISGQKEELKRAIDTVVEAFHAGKVVGFH
ncbi:MULTISPECIES: hypothetical protein [Bacillaceae]|uniref:Tyrosine-protein phosphatase n=1 Tax=Evansella alkalicola TaxID=745819 RepID=A0ABS6JNI6_9BACI|nr:MULTISPECIES: hypothetical protein [Bacillaceae]MBU9720122.1 tyrosine-protein phosphatase [Bacillus alkalicola]